MVNIREKVVDKERDKLEALRKMSHLFGNELLINFKDFRVVDARLYKIVIDGITESLTFAPNLDVYSVNDDLNQFLTFVLCDDGNWRSLIPMDLIKEGT